MSENVLVKARFSKLNSLTLCCFGIAVLSLVVCFIVATAVAGDPAWAFEGIEYGYYWFFIGSFVFVLIGLIFISMKFELVVTDSRVIGKTVFGKRVDLPISQVSMVGTGIFKRVSIATSSGLISFYGVSNQNEVFSIISKLLLKRQEETKVVAKAPESSATDELKKLKDLLDMGVITQEEFDAKKKQLLGL